MRSEARCRSGNHNGLCCFRNAWSLQWSSDFGALVLMLRQISFDLVANNNSVLFSCTVMMVIFRGCFQLHVALNFPTPLASMSILPMMGFRSVSW
ncbi:hypothetical protein TIFTF001_008572 [Ficus carica]|uniref:Uncharacterized protein n=1 Tax=Ficus carica TaxID=3494 RepID=A0AA87ZT95_FICCA|nr:hypothetical protein TIFTF001_008572 [Ficus carica]